MRIYTDNFSGVFGIFVQNVCLNKVKFSFTNRTGYKITQHVSSATQVRKKPSVADNCLQLQARAFFNDFWIFQLLSKITQMAFTSAGNVVSGSKLVTRSHVQPATLQKQSMRIQTTGQDLDLILTFRITVSRLTRFFTCNQRLSSTVLSSRAHFFSNGAPNDTNKNSPGQCYPNFPIRCADSSKK